MTVKTVPERSGLSSTHTRDVYYGYDLRGLQLYARYDSTSGEGVSSTYDGFGRLASSSLTMDGATRTLSYQWDKDGNRTELTWPDSNKTSYSYDGLDRMGTLYEGGIGSTVNMLTYGYNNRGLRSSQTGRYGQATSFSYDAVGRLNSFNHDFAGTSKDVSYGATFTPASQIATRTTSNDAYAWTGAVSVSRNYAVNGLNQYTSVGGGAITYDDNGNLTSSNSITYQYDVENRLVSASGAISASLRYDPLGRLYEVTGSSGTTRFLYDGDELVAEYNTSGTLLRRYAHGTSVDDPMVWYEGSGYATPRFLHSNWQGSVVAVTDSSASSIATNSYDEWGIPAATNQGRFQYTGQAWLPEIGMYYYKARIYSPTLGRFMQTDPVGYDDQINLYAYVGNDPVNMTDPSGMQSIELYPDGDVAEAGAKGRPRYPGVAIVAAHGWENGRVQGPDSQAITPKVVLEKLLAADYKKGTPIILLSCNTAGGSFPSKLAELSGGIVYAAGGFVRIPKTQAGVSNFTFTSNTGRNNSGESSGWLAYNAKGVASSAGVQSFRISVKDGVASLKITLGAQTGSRIQKQIEKKMTIEESKK